MPRPSGECNGQACYTSADLDEIQAELDVATASQQVAQAALDTANNLVMNLQMEQQQAQMNQCPS